MTIWWLGFILGSLAAVFFAFMWIAAALSRLSPRHHADAADPKKAAGLDKAYSDIAEEEATHLFNSEFREELRNRGRLRFETIIDENAMFLKQDLDLTIAQLNEYMKTQISSKLDAEFAVYAKAMGEAQELALNTLKKTAQEVESQRVQLGDALKKDVAEREAALLKMYEENMAKIIEHYVLLALGDQIDLKAQLPYIIAQMEANKPNIIEDMRL